jgi:hypothetical protein
VEFVCGRERYQAFKDYLQDQLVQGADTVTRCANPDCNAAIDTLGASLCNVIKCGRCGNEFCGDTCGQASHAPATCVEVQRWNEATGVEMMQRRAYGADLKTCPACKKDINKNGGCNHMSCPCGHQFCWLCLVPWHPSHYSCKGLPPEQDPFLKKPDDIEKAFLAPYHDKFLRLGLTNREWTEKRATIIGEISRARDTGANSARAFADAMYWARENLKWTIVHQFWTRFEQVKGLPPARQGLLDDPPRTTEQKLLEFARKQLEEVVSQIDRRCVITSGKMAQVGTSQDIAAWTKSVNAHRDALLKHCDPHYA